MKARFVVQHDVLSGLKYLQVIKRKGVRVSKNEEMIVSHLVSNFFLWFCVRLGLFKGAGFLPFLICRKMHGSSNK